MTADVKNFAPIVTNTQPPDAAPLKRCAIVGTAQSWKQCPWEDKTLEVWGLNDAYLIGVPRADRWFDLHPFHQMHFRQPNANRQVDGSTVPLGSYLRPMGHLDWLRTRPMPVFLAEARPDYPMSRTFPRQAVLDFFQQYWPLRRSRTGTMAPGPDYEVSTPAWMLMLAILEGYQEIHIYGIHLATQWEYVQQRPNFEFLLGIAAARGAKVVLPASTPICKASYRYAFEPKADLPLQQLEMDVQTIKQRGLKLKQQHASTGWFEFGRRKELASQIRRIDVLLADARQQQQRVQARLQG